MKGKYVIIDLRNMDFMKNEEGKIKYYDTMDEAYSICGVYEFKNAWVMQLIYNHIEDTEFCDWMTSSGYKDEQKGTMKKGNKRYCINNLFKHYQNLLEFGNQV